MKEIQPGIFSEEKELVKLADKPLVLVHPYFGDHGSPSFFCVEDGSAGRGYLSNLDKLLKNSKDRNIFVFEIESELERTRQKISISSGLEGKYFITTIGNANNAEATPLHSGWDEVNYFLGNFGKDFLFAGGYIGFSLFGEDFGGCLGGAYHSLSKNKNGQFFLPSCYSNERYHPMFFVGDREELSRDLRNRLIQENNRTSNRANVFSSQEECNAHLSKVLKPWLEIGKL